MSDQIKPQYVVGFFFGHDRRSVALIRKNKPEWQAGKLNGIGGRVEPGETPIEGIVREFAEETGKHTHQRSWRFFAVLRARECDVHFFEQSGNGAGIESPTSEQVDWYSIHHLLQNVLPNLRWLIPLALSNEPPVVIYQGKPFDHVISEQETEQIDYEVQSIEPNE